LTPPSCWNGGFPFGLASPDCFEQPPQGERSDDADEGERGGKFQVFRPRHVHAKQRKHQYLRCDGDAITDGNIGDGFHQRHGAGLFHCAIPSFISADCLQVR